MTPCLQLHDDTQLLQLGLGLWRVPDSAAASLVRSAVDAGYRLFDTAWVYFNEKGTGEGLRTAAVPREQLYVSTKLWNKHQGFDSALRAFDTSLELLGLDYVDLYLMHWPAPALDQYVETWRAFIRLRGEGRVRSIGVCNFQESHLQRLLAETGVAPVLNQVELHPMLQQRTLREFHRRAGIVTQSWSPLAQGKLFGNDTLARIAARHQKTTAQVMLRWHLQNGLAVIPKSVDPARIRENLGVFDFELDPADMRVIEGLDQGFRIGPDPDSYSQL